MTQIVKLVSMVNEPSRPPSFEEITAALARFQPADPTDARAKKRQRIIEAASALFLAQGYRKTSLEEIARQAGVAKGTVYLYFASKVELLMQAVVAEKQQQIGKIKPLLDPALDPFERLRRYIKIAMVAVTEMPLVSRLLTGDREMAIALSELDPAMRASIEAQRADFLIRMLRPALPELDEETLADRGRALTGLLFTAPFATPSERGELPLERYAELVATIVVDGLSCCPDPAKTEEAR